MAYTLFLDSSYRPISRRPWQDAVVAYFTGRAEILSYYAGRIVHPISGLLMPAVVRMVTALTRHRPMLRFSKYNIWLRDNRECQYCGVPLSRNAFDLEHIIPKHRGGTTCWTNIVAACHACNQRKGGYTPAEAGMRLRTTPCAPSVAIIIIPEWEFWLSNDLYTFYK